MGMSEPPLPPGHTHAAILEKVNSDQAYYDFCRCRWLDIAESQPCHKALSADNFGLHATVRPSQEWLEAMQNARLWKKYGEEKQP